MQVVIEKDPIAFLNKYEAWLRQKTSENNLILGVLNGCKTGKYKEGIFLAVVENEKPLLLAVQTPPKNLVLSEDGSKESLKVLVEFLVKEDIKVPGSIGSPDNVKFFIESYGSLVGKEFAPDMVMHIYSVNKVVVPEKIEGKLVFATQDDLEFSTKSLYDFSRESMPETEHLNIEELREKTLKSIQKGKVAIWKVNNKDVAIIVFDNLEYMGRITNVYTPPEFRKRGYAAAMTAQISQMLLDRGCDSVCLFADATNPTSNGVYQRIGYKHVTDSIVYVLKD